MHNVKSRSANRSLARVRLLLASTSMAAALALTPALAQTWDGETSTNYLTGTNWDGDVAPAAGGAVVIDGQGGLNQPTLNVGNISTVDTVAVSAGTLTVIGSLTTTTGTTISGTGTVLVSAGTGSLNGAVETTGTGFLSVGGTVTGNVTNLAAGPGGLANTGLGTIDGNVTSSGAGSSAGTITGTLDVTAGSFENSGTVDGNSSVSDGMLTLTMGSNLGDATTVAVSGTGTLNVDADETVATVTQTGGTIDSANGSTLTTGAFSQNGGEIAAGGTVSATTTANLLGGTIAGTLGGAGTATVQTGITSITTGQIVGNVTLASGTLSLGNNAAVTGTITTTGSVIDIVGGITSSAPINLDSNTTQIQVTAGSGTQAGVISETTGPHGFEKIGAGSLTVTGTNTYSGTTVISEGNLTAASDSALGTGAATVADGATLSLQGTITTANDITLNGVGDGGGGALRNRSDNNVVDGEITLASDARINTDAGQGELNGNITGTDTALTVGGTGTTLIAGDIATGAGSLTVDATTATGIVQLAGNNSFTGGTTVSSGFLQLLGGSALDDGGALTVNSPGTVQVFDGETVGALSGAGTIALQTADALVAGDGTDTTFSGQIIESGAVGTFTKAGTGTLILSGASTYTGQTTVNGGVLALTGGAAIANGSAVHIGAAGTLSSTTDNEVIGTLTGDAGGTLNIGATVFTTSSNTNSEFAGALVGGAAAVFSKDGTGVLTLSGDNSGFDGTVGTSLGEIVLAAGSTLNASAIGAVAGATLSIEDGAALTGTDLALISDGIINVNGDTTVAFLTNNNFDGPGTGTINLNGAGTVLTLAGGSLASAHSGAINGEGGLATTGGTHTLSGDIAIDGGVDVNTGSTLVLAGDNSIGGGITVAGTLRLESDTAAGGATGSITTDGSVIDYADGVNSATPITLASDDTDLQVLVGSATQSGNIDETGGARPLEKIGAGTLTLSGVNTYTGATTITAGTLIVTSGAALSDTGTVTIANGGTLTVDTNQEFIGNLASSDVATSTAIVNVNAGLVIFGADDTTFDGNISGSTQLTYQGTGSLTLTGANALTGNLTSSGLGGGNDGTDDGAINITGAGTVASGFIVALDGGTITTDGGALVSNANLIVDGANSSATLTGSETIGALLGNGPGVNTTGTVTLTGAGTILTLNGTSAFDSQIGSLVTGTGTLNVTGGTTTVAAAGDVQVATTIGASGTVDNNGTMAAVTNAGVFTNNGTAGALTNTGAGTGSNGGTLASLTHNSTGTFTNAGVVTGDTAVSAGIVNLNADTNLSDTGTLTVTGGVVNVNAAETVGRLAAEGGSVSLVANLRAGELSGAAGSIALTSGATTLFAGDSDGIDSTFGGVISGIGVLDKSGTDTLMLTGENTMTGLVIVNAGTLALTGAGSLDSTIMNIAAGGTVSTDGSAFLATLFIANDGRTGAVAAPFGLMLTDGGDETIAGMVGGGTTNLSAGSVLTLTSGPSGIGGVMSGAGALNITGGTTTVGATGSVQTATTIGASGTVINNGAMAGVTNAGLFTTVGQVGDGIANSGVVNASGTVNGPIGNTAGASFTLLGAATGNGLVTNAGLFVAPDATSFTGLAAFDNAGETRMRGTSTLGAMAFGNTGLIDIEGSATIATGLLTQAGTVDMTGNGLVDRLTVAGNLGGTGAYALDLDLTRDNGGVQLSDQVIVNGNMAGTGVVNFALAAGPLTLQSSPIVVFDVAGANTSALTAAGLPMPGGIIEYDFRQQGSDWVVASGVNPAIGGVAGNVALVQTLVGTVVNRPTSPFTTGLAFETDGKTCGAGPWARATGGAGTATGTTTGGLAAATSEVSTTYGGLQGGLDWACFEDDSGWSYAFGGFIGLNAGSSSQDVFASVGGVPVLTSVTTSEFDQRYGGVYAAASKGAFSADVQLRYDASDFTFNNRAVGGFAPLGLTNAGLDSERTTVSASAAYQFTVSDFAVTPLAGLSVSRTSSSLLRFDGGETLQPLDYTSIVGFAGVSISRQFVLADEQSALIPFLTATLYNDFGDDPESVFTDSAGTQLAGNLVSENLGMFAELSAGVNYLKIFDNEGGLKQLNAGLRGDVKFSDRLEAAGITLQIRGQW